MPDDFFSGFSDSLCPCPEFVSITGQIFTMAIRHMLRLHDGLNAVCCNLHKRFVVYNIKELGKNMQTLGMMIVLDPSEAQQAIDILASYGDKASVIGRVTNVPGINII